MLSRINAFQRMPGRLVQEDDIDALFGRPEIEPDARETGRQVQTLSILLLSESISNAQAKSALACDPCEAIRLDSENVFEAFYSYALTADVQVIRPMLTGSGTAVLPAVRMVVNF